MLSLLPGVGSGGGVYRVLFDSAATEGGRVMREKLANFAKTLTDNDREVIGFIAGLLLGAGIGMGIVFLGQW